MFRLVCICCSLYRDFETFDDAYKVAKQRWLDGEYPSRILNPKGEVVFETATVRA